MIVVIIYEHNNDFGVDTILKEKKAKIYGKHSRKYEGKLVPKKTHGVYYTTGNPFVLKPFSSWAEKINLTKLEILEPFAGANNIIKMLKETGCKSFKSFDIKPQSPDVKKKDTLKNFPKGFKVCITNPPWLTSYSAKRHGVDFPDIEYDNIYKHCLGLALQNCDFVAFIIPGTFLTWAMRTPKFRERLEKIIYINSKLFMDTDNPVCLALFGSKQVKETRIYNDNKLLGKLDELSKHMPLKLKNGKEMTFNSDKGNLGLICIDNTTEASIRFCQANEITRKYEGGKVKARKMKVSDRLLTKIKVNVGNEEKAIKLLNKRLNSIRKDTHDVFFAPFKGLRKDGRYRRRVDFIFVRNLIDDCFQKNHKKISDFI